ncbi:MAG: DNA-methyltransferase [Candidatus Helarchaeota archaeon]
MQEIEDKTIHLMVTSPPYYNAPFDYMNFFKNYDDYLTIMENVANETYRVLADGRICCINCDDMLINGEKFPIVADLTKIFMKVGFKYRDRIIWKKPDGYIRISRRSGVLLQHPYPMYFYPDNLLESILIFQKGKFNYQKFKKAKMEIFENSKINISKFQKDKWFLTIWEMTNVLPIKRIEKTDEISIAAFPDELPYRLITLFSFKGEIVLDPFLGSGTTTKIASLLKRSSIGYEIDKRLLPIIKKKIGYDQKRLGLNDRIEFVFREKNPYENIKKACNHNVSTHS